MIKTLLYSIVLLSVLQLASDATAQQNSSLVLRSPSVDIKTVLLSISPLIDVEYQGESIVVLKADEDTLLISNGTMSPFWNAIDAVKHYGYTVEELATSGMGSQGNPTRFYAVMSRP
jgi:hypothetical protein